MIISDKDISLQKEREGGAKFIISFLCEGKREMIEIIGIKINVFLEICNKC